MRRLIYAVGDIHGQFERLERLVRRCRRDASQRGPAKVSLVFLGDYIDRGPSSRKVIEFLIGLQSEKGQDVLCLKGNHEAVLIASAQLGFSEIEDPSLGEWLRSGGGGATLASYGAIHPAELPIEHLTWINSLPCRFDDGTRFFVHAGVNPACALEELGDTDAMWIREPFLSETKDYGRLIVHGHTPLHSGIPDLRSNRLNLDTAAGYGGPISAAVFDADIRDPIGFLAA